MQEVRIRLLNERTMTREKEKPEEGENERLEKARSIIEKNSTKDVDSGCWEWNRFIAESGYGQTRFDGKTWKAHRLSHIAFKGEIGAGLEIDHLCRNRCCVNPSHLEAVTRAVNVYRGISFAAVNWRKTHCVQGHEFTKENTNITKYGYRRCIACNRFSSKAVRLNQRLDAYQADSNKENL